MSRGEATRRAARLFVPALLLDRDSPGEIRRAADRALELGVGGFLLFGGEAGRVRELTARLRERAGRELWFAADLERGAGQQFTGAAELPPPAALARAPEPAAAARTAGRITALEARRLGVNWALAPVLDLDVEPDNPIVGTRSFGREPGRVSRLGRAWIEGCQRQGVAACGKHFPGHGRTTADSHLELPRVEADRAVLAEEDLVPFRDAAPELASVMTAHVAYPGLGGGGRALPATLDRTLLEGVLRGSMDFAGLVVTDALTMEGVRGDDPEEGARAAEAVRAGCDLLLYPRDLEAAVRGLAERIEGGGEPRLGERVRESASRSRRVRSRIAAREPGGDVAPSPGSDPGSAELARAGLELAVRCVEARGAGAGEAPAGLDPSRPLRAVPVSDDLERPGEAEFGGAFVEELRGLGWRAELAPARADEGEGGGQCAVLLRSTPQADKGRALPPEDVLASVRSLADAGGAAALVVFGHERVLRAVDRPGLCAWSAEGVMQRAAARRLDAAVRGA